jgi:hypothetical protein
MPGGWPPNERERDACARVLLACSGDFERIIDAPALDDEAYARHIARIRFFDCPDAKPLFFVGGELASAERVMRLRSRLHGLTEAFDQSSWVVCLPPTGLDDFIAQAADWAGVEEVVAEGLFAWRTSPWPILVADWSVAGVDIAAALTSVETAPESGFIATVAASHERAAFNAEGAVVGLESLAQMRAMPRTRPPHEREQPLQALVGPAGELSAGLVRPNPRIRHNGR